VPGRSPCDAGRLAQSISIPSPATDRLCAAARAARVAVAIGINERNVEASGTTLYNSLLYIDEAGRLLGSHRKLVPTAGERLVYGQGDGSTLAVHDLAIGKVGGLVCWENYMPLARYAMYAAGVQIYIAPTWDRGEPWISAPAGSSTSPATTDAPTCSSSPCSAGYGRWCASRTRRRPQIRVRKARPGASTPASPSSAALGASPFPV
jgi:hypothetical protein